MPSWADLISGAKGFVNEYVVEISPDAPEAEKPQTPAQPPATGVNPLAKGTAAATAVAPIPPPAAPLPPPVTKVEPPPQFVAKLREKVATKQQLTVMLMGEVTDGAEFFPNNEAGLFAFALKKGKKAGMTVVGLVQELDAQLEIINTESTKFGAALEKQVTEEVGTKRGVLEGFDSQIDSARRQIAQLEASIQQLSAQKETIQGEIGTTQSKAEQVRAGFNLAADLLRGEIGATKSKVQAYLKD